MLFPWTDWQFWLVTAIASWCAWIVLRQLLPRQKSSTSCGACASGTAACAKQAAGGGEDSNRADAWLGDHRPAAAAVEDRGQRVLEM